MRRENICQFQGTGQPERQVLNTLLFIHKIEIKVGKTRHFLRFSLGAALAALDSVLPVCLSLELWSPPKMPTLGLVARVGLTPSCRSDPPGGHLCRGCPRTQLGLQSLSSVHHFACRQEHKMMEVGSSLLTQPHLCPRGWGLGSSHMGTTVS